MGEVAATWLAGVFLQAYVANGIWTNILARYTSGSSLWSIPPLMSRSSLGSCQLLVLQIDAGSGASARPVEYDSRGSAKHGEFSFMSDVKVKVCERTSNGGADALYVSDWTKQGSH